MVNYPDGAIWFVETGANALGRFTRGCTFNEYKFPTPNASLRGVTVGQDGHVWCTENFANKIGHMARDEMLLGEYAIPTPRAERAALQAFRTAGSISHNMTPARSVRSFWIERTPWRLNISNIKTAALQAAAHSCTTRKSACPAVTADHAELARCLQIIDKPRGRNGWQQIHCVRRRYVRWRQDNGRTTGSRPAGKCIARRRNRTATTYRRRSRNLAHRKQKTRRWRLSRQAAAGLCFGGGNVLELARTGADVKAVVCLHGDLLTPTPARAGEIKAAVCVLHGSADPVVPKKDRDAFEAEMEASGAKWQMLVFGGLLH